MRPLANAIPAGRGPVHDLTIEGVHEFFADGVLVHNCSSGVSWVLKQAGVTTPPYQGGNAPVSGAYLKWGKAGRGRQVTIWTHAGHIWIQFHGFKHWRFDTGGGSGGKLWTTPRSTGGFTARTMEGL